MVHKGDNNWIQEMIEREAIPKPAREDMVEDFCKKHNIAINTYYYQSRKKENQKKILEIALANVKKEAPEILKVLVSKSKAGDMRAIDMYLNYILKLAKQLDLKSDGKPLPILGGIVNNKETSKCNIEKQQQ